MIEAEVPQYKTRKILTGVLHLYDSPKLTTQEKSNTLRLVLNTMVNSNLQKDSLAAPLLRCINVQMQDLPPLCKQEIKGLLESLDAGLLFTFFPGERSEAKSVPVAETATPVAPESEPNQTQGPKARVPIQIPTNVSASFEQRVASWLKTVQDWTTFLDELQQYVGGFEQPQVELERKLAHSEAERQEALNAAAQKLTAYNETESKMHSLQQRFQQIADENQILQERADSLESRLTGVVHREAELRKELAQKELDASAERGELMKRIQSNADRRVNEYRNSLGSALARLFYGLPARSSSVPVELSQVMLTRLYEVIDYLESRDVPILAREKGDR